MDIDAWDLRHLLLSLDDRPRGRRDSDDLDGVVRRAAAALASVPRPPTLRVPPQLTAPLRVRGLPLWIFETNAWLVAPDGPGGDCMIVDVPPSPGTLVERIRRQRLRPVAIVVTHAHFDHAGGTGTLLEALDDVVPVYVHPDDRHDLLHPQDGGALARLEPDVVAPPSGALVDLVDGQLLTVGTMTVRAVHVPGHTPGSTCVVVEGGARPLLFTGDTLFAAGTGRCDLPGGSRDVAEASLQALIAQLADETVVLPGHGGITTIGAERGAHLTLPPLAA